MLDITYRNANINDISIIVDAIIEAEKSGTNRLSYTAIFGLTENEVRKYLKEMLLEEIDGCGELSISSYMIAEKDKKSVAAACAWIEGKEGVPTQVLKGNLLRHVLPREVIMKSIAIKELLHELHFDYKSNAIHMGAGYVVKESRGHGLFRIIKEMQIEQLMKENPEVTEAYVDTFEVSKAALRSSEKLGFQLIEIKEASSDEILKYLPSKRKYFLKKTLK